MLLCARSRTGQAEIHLALQKKNRNINTKTFISKGVWSWSRFPKYVIRCLLVKNLSSYVVCSCVGELGIWTGIFGPAAFSGILPVSAAVATAAKSYILLRHLTSIPPLERAAEKGLATIRNGRNIRGKFSSIDLCLLYCDGKPCQRIVRWRRQTYRWHRGDVLLSVGFVETGSS
ncbi:hypothetical protein BDR05DRAFT_598529 [Suillus weaverae]|nr:hypothetical protein BDR05DRAFT_598529 [Suillus weaverae]